MRFNGDARKMLLKQVKKRTQGTKKKRKPPRRSPKGPRGPPVEADDLVRDKEAMNTMQNTDMQDQYLHPHSISGRKFSSKIQGFPIRQKFPQGPKANAHAKKASHVVTSALKEKNKGRVQNRAKKMLNKAKGVRQTKGRLDSNKTDFVKELFERNPIEGTVLPFTTKYPTSKRNVKRTVFKSKGAHPRFSPFLNQESQDVPNSNMAFHCSSDSDNENIPLNKLKQIQRSRTATYKPSQSPLVSKTAQQKLLAKRKKEAVLVSQQKNVKEAMVKSNKKLESVVSEMMATPEKGMALRCFKLVVQVVDISPLIDRTKVSQTADTTETASIANEYEQCSEGAELANPLVWEEECDDYELVEMMERTDVLDCCSRSTSPSEKVAVYSHARGQYVYVPRSHPSLHAAPLPHVEQLDIPDAIRANILYQKAKESEKKDYERGTEMVLNYGYQWMKVPVGGPRYPASTLRHLAKVNRTGTEYWRQMHTPSTRFTEARKRLINKRVPTATVTRAEANYRQEQYGVSRK